MRLLHASNVRIGIDPLSEGAKLAGFFERRVMKDVYRRLNVLLPGVGIGIVLSDYNPGGWCVRILVTDEVFTDTTLDGLGWATYIGISAPDIQMSPAARIAERHRIGRAPSPRQIAESVADYHVNTWDNLARFPDVLRENVKNLGAG